MSRQPSADIIAAAKAAHGLWPDAPVSVQLAQWALESAWGTRCTGPWNYWGFKAVGSQPFVMCPTHEVYKGVRVLVDQPFRLFKSEAESFTAHAKLLATGAPYADFRHALPDIHAAVYLLGGGTPQHPRYATAPAKVYGDSLWALISPRGNNFARYDA